MPGWRLLETTDPLEYKVLQIMADKAAEAYDYMMKQQGVHVANAVGKMMGG